MIFYIKYILLFVFIKEYNEVAPIFAEEFYDELSDAWNLLDHEGNTHVINFNKYSNHPLLTGDGLTSEFYGFLGGQETNFNYLFETQYELPILSKHTGIPNSFFSWGKGSSITERWVKFDKKLFHKLNLSSYE